MTAPWLLRNGKKGKPAGPPRRLITSSAPGVLSAFLSPVSSIVMWTTTKYLSKIGLASADSINLSSFLHHPHQEAWKIVKIARCPDAARVCASLRSDAADGCASAAAIAPPSTAPATNVKQFGLSERIPTSAATNLRRPAMYVNPLYPPHWKP